MLSLVSNGLSVPAPHRQLEFGAAPHYPATGECANPSADPVVPGVMQGGPTLGVHSHIVLGIAPDYPPYTKWEGDGVNEPWSISGFSYEIGSLFEPMCGIRVDYTLAGWDECWAPKEKTRQGARGGGNLYFSQVSEYVGDGIEAGHIHGCAAYTHTKGERNLSLDFSNAVLGDLKTAGILTRLVNGEPVVSPTLTDYSDVKLCDVTGWAPTLDTFPFNHNTCAGGAKFTGKPVGMAESGNQAAITALKSGECDALYLYADQMKNSIDEGHEWASGFGTTFAYIHTGLNGWSINGTTFSISKKGSGLPALVNPCIDKVVRTPEYKAICEKYFPATSCIGGTDDVLLHDVPMDKRTDAYGCVDGYCKCDA